MHDSGHSYAMFQSVMIELNRQSICDIEISIPSITDPHRCELPNLVETAADRDLRTAYDLHGALWSLIDPLSHIFSK
jgi:hypothetical protein